MLTRLHFSTNHRCCPHVRDFQGRPSVLRSRGGRLSVRMQNRHGCLPSDVTKKIGDAGECLNTHIRAQPTRFSARLFFFVCFLFPDVGRYLHASEAPNAADKERHCHSFSALVERSEEKKTCVTSEKCSFVTDKLVEDLVNVFYQRVSII